WSGQPGLRAVFAGEVAASLREELQKRKAHVWSLFGTAATGLVAFARDHAEGTGGGELGKPLANVHAKVADPSGLLAPSGVPGTLEVSAYGLPTLPFEARTRWRSDGTLESAGGAAIQSGASVVDGLSAFPEELQAALRAHPSVEAAAAVAHLDRLGERQWV